jgi:NAD(P)-dependent dehydrogenase (short-subunit alcohol dehydrogenase family)
LEKIVTASFDASTPALRTDAGKAAGMNSIVPSVPLLSRSKRHVSIDASPPDRDSHYGNSINPHTHMELTGKAALVTGGTRGIGAATAIAFAKEGADVAISARHDDDAARQTQREIEALGRRCEIITADCGVATDCTRLVEQAAKALGRLDVLVHAAGGAVPGGLLEVTPEAWNDAFNVHVHAVYHLSRAAVPHLRREKEGAIILVSSTAGKLGVMGNLAYQAVKGALPHLTRALARELANDNIRVNCVAPGVIRTRFHEHMSAEQKKLNLEQRIPLHREGTPAQVADGIVMLVKNDYITGDTVTIDGGLTSRIA